MIGAAPKPDANQSPVLRDVNFFLSDQALKEAVVRLGAGGEVGWLSAFGRLCGSGEAGEQGRLANEHPPRLKTHDAKGNRVDLVEFHPAYHAAMRASMAAGLHARVWDHLAEQGAPPAPGVHVARAAGLYLAAQMETGHCCPITMTSAAVAALSKQPDVLAEWLPRVLGREYDPRSIPAKDKTAVTIGMGMTERQGGTDVRANTSRALPLTGSGPGRSYRLTGHKWFMSAPMSDAFLMLAQAPGGLSCFLVPRLAEDGSANGLRFQRLKDKLGNRSNASSEVEFEDAEGRLIGEEGRGVAVIIEMVTATRLDCALASAGLMRRALVEVVHHIRHRKVFGALLADQPAMRAVVADMLLDVEAAMALSLRLASAFDRAEADEREAAWRRLMTPVTKYWVCKIAAPLIGEAMECLGGNGYVEESILPRLYREAPVNAIWEGSGNVMALDVLRVLNRAPEALDVVLEIIDRESGGDKAVAAWLAEIRSLARASEAREANARALTERLALAAAASQLYASGVPAMAEAYAGTRLAGPFRHTYGQGLARHDTAAIVNRALPG